MLAQFKTAMVTTTDLQKFQNRTDKSIRCLAFFKARPGKSEELESILLDLVEPTRGEPGNIAYVLHRSTKDPDSLVFDEVWTDMAALEAHLRKPYLRALPEKINGLLQEPVRIETYTEIRAAK